MKFRTLSSLSFAVLTAWSVLAAQEPPPGASEAGAPPPSAPQGPRVPPVLLKAYDKDGDGKLNEAERDALRADMQAAVKKYDANADGRLSPDEIEKAKAENSVLAEALSMRGQRKGPQDGERGPGGAERGPKLSPELLKAYDKDGDGKLSETEREALKTDVQAAVKKYDTNADGKLTGEELEKAKAENPALVPLLERAGQHRGQAGDRPNKEHKGKKAKEDAATTTTTSTSAATSTTTKAAE